MRDLVLLLFRPARFVEVATGLVLESEPAAYGTQERRDELRKQTERSTALIRASLGRSFLVSAATIVAGLATGGILRSTFGAPEFHIAVVFLQSAGAVIILAATLSLLGWEIQTFSGKSPAEELNRLAYRVLYVFGTYLVVASLVL
jgi:hypothetical protein